MTRLIPHKPTASRTSDAGSGTGDAEDDTSVAKVRLSISGIMNPVGPKSSEHFSVRHRRVIPLVPPNWPLIPKSLEGGKNRSIAARRFSQRNDVKTPASAVSPMKAKFLPSRPLAVKVMSVTEFVTESQMKFVVNDSTVGPGLNPPMPLSEPRVQ